MKGLSRSILSALHVGRAEIPNITPLLTRYSKSLSFSTDENLKQETNDDRSPINLNSQEDIDELILRMERSHSRKERKDSINEQIISERRKHLNRVLDLYRNRQTLLTSKERDHLSKEGKRLSRLRFGEKRRLAAIHNFKNNSLMIHYDDSEKSQRFGASGFGQYLVSASKNPWPVFDHLLPEIGFAGHSNCGKSSLVNALIGKRATNGPAAVSDRAGWTNQICFYQLGKKPPVFTLVDFPGYGHSIATDLEKKEFKTMVRTFLQDREVLSLTALLVDCSRGLCTEDIALIRYLLRNNRAFIIVVTKCDLLDAELLAYASKVLHNDITEIVKANTKRLKLRANEGSTSKSEVDIEALDSEEDDEDYASPVEVPLVPSVDESRLINDAHIFESIEGSVSAEDELELFEDEDDFESKYQIAQRYNKEQAINHVKDESTATVTMKKRQQSVNSQNEVILFRGIFPVSANTSAGVQKLYTYLTKVAYETSFHPHNDEHNKYAIREHVNSQLTRSNSKYKKTSKAKKGSSPPPIKLSNRVLNKLKKI